MHAKDAKMYKEIHIMGRIECCSGRYGKDRSNVKGTTKEEKSGGR
jgi:hypothetical protein